MGRPESLSYLQSALALDPRLHVLIACGLFDLVTPYFTTVRELNQLPDAGSADRVRLVVYPGGHMFYSDDASRAAFRDAASALFQAPPPRHHRARSDDLRNSVHVITGLDPVISATPVTSSPGSIR